MDLQLNKESSLQILITSILITESITVLISIQFKKCLRENYKTKITENILVTIKKSVFYHCVEQ